MCIISAHSSGCGAASAAGPTAFKTSPTDSPRLPAPAARATARAPTNARSSLCVSVVDARTNSATLSGSFQKAAPITGARMAAPFPAVRTPFENPSASFAIERAVPSPPPGGPANSHPTSRHRRRRRNRSASPPHRNSACPTRKLCSVSSERTARPKNGPRDQSTSRTARRGKPSTFSPNASPTAVPSRV